MYMYKYSIAYALVLYSRNVYHMLLEKAYSSLYSILRYAIREEHTHNTSILRERACEMCSICFMLLNSIECFAASIQTTM